MYIWIHFASKGRSINWSTFFVEGELLIPIIKVDKIGLVLKPKSSLIVCDFKIDNLITIMIVFAKRVKHALNFVYQTRFSTHE